MPRELAGVYGEFVVESQKAGDCFSLFQVLDVDTRGNPLSSRDDLDYQGPPEAESVWICPVAAESVPTCEGCVFYVRRKLDLVQVEGLLLGGTAGSLGASSGCDQGERGNLL